MKKLKRGRHAPAFILLFLAEAPGYGLDLYNKMNSEIPYNKIDTAAIYRALKELENDGMVESCWNTSESGPAKKVYSITEKGLEKLNEYNVDIQRRIENLSLFISKYNSLNEKGGL